MCSCGNAVKGERLKIFAENFLSLVYFTLDGVGTTPTLVFTPPLGRGLPSAGEADSFFFSPEFFFFAKKNFGRRPQTAKLPLFSGKKTYQAERSRAR